MGRLKRLREILWWRIVSPAVLTLALLVPIHEAYAGKPLDPLTAAEKQQALRIARTDARVSRLLGARRSRLLEVEFVTIKPEGEELPQDDEGMARALGRKAAVYGIEYESNQGFRAVVDLLEGTVINVERLDGDSVPATGEELEEARRLVLQHHRVRALIGGRATAIAAASAATTAATTAATSIDGQRLVTTDVSDPCYQRRCMLMLFRRNRQYQVDLPTVIVDLTGQTVRMERSR
jgi:Cu2+-containing amine oxidase